ncbi:MAG: histidine kinase [Anaerolineae bacterium]|nr:histidine kinase [Anaerolineae bacterium]
MASARRHRRDLSGGGAQPAARSRRRSGADAGRLLLLLPRQVRAWRDGKRPQHQYHHCTRLQGLEVGSDGLRYHASVPLYHHNKRVGVLNVVSADWRELSEDDLRLLNTVGDMLSIAIERAQLFANSIQLGAAEERNRLAREIHDTLAQGLTAIALQLETADALLESGSDRARGAVTR